MRLERQLCSRYLRGATEVANIDRVETPGEGGGLSDSSLPMCGCDSLSLSLVQAREGGGEVLSLLHPTQHTSNFYTYVHKCRERERERERLSSTSLLHKIFFFIRQMWERGICVTISNLLPSLREERAPRHLFHAHTHTGLCCLSGWGGREGGRGKAVSGLVFQHVKTNVRRKRERGFPLVPYLPDLNAARSRLQS